MADSHPEPIETRVLLEGGWRVVGASVIGSSHVSAGGHREDSFAVAVVEGCAIAVVCDGAGSARYAADGATRFSASVLRELADLASLHGGKPPPEQFRDAVVAGVELSRAAIEDNGLALQDHHATLLAVAATKDWTLIAHVGDGLAAIAAEGNWPQAALSHPQNGEFANETFFVTEEGWAERLRCAVAPALCSGGAAVLLTDGAMPFVIGPNQVGLEPGFMEPVSRYLRSVGAAVAAEALAGTLDSADARRISSDDKTLVWLGLEQ